MNTEAQADFPGSYIKNRVYVWWNEGQINITVEVKKPLTTSDCPLA